MYRAVYNRFTNMDQENTRFRLKIKLPSGSEFEAEGSRDFVLSERERFLEHSATEQDSIGSHKQTNTASSMHKPPEYPPTAIEPLNLMPPKSIEKAGEVWQKIAIIKDNIVILKVKHPQIAAQEAALTIAGATRAICDIQPIPALTLSKSLRKSGYITGRLDRLLGHEIAAGRMMPVGTKRNRAYHLSDKGLARAYILAEKLSERIPQQTTPKPTSQ